MVKQVNLASGIVFSSFISIVATMELGSCGVSFSIPERKYIVVHESNGREEKKYIEEEIRARTRSTRAPGSFHFAKRIGIIMMRPSKGDEKQKSVSQLKIKAQRKPPPHFNQDFAHLSSLDAFHICNGWIMWISAQTYKRMQTNTTHIHYANNHFLAMFCLSADIFAIIASAQRFNDIYRIDRSWPVISIITY